MASQSPRCGWTAKGNVMDMAIGIVIGGAFATIASSLVANIIAPIIGFLSSGVDTADLFLVSCFKRRAGWSALFNP